MSGFAIGLVLVSCVLHALWNVVAKRSERTIAFFVVANLGLLLALPLFATSGGVELVRAAPPGVWICLTVTGGFQALYFVGLARAYAGGDISLVYPLMRSFPVLVMLAAGFMFGQWPSRLAWLGLLLVVAGCFATPASRGGARASPGRPVFWAVIAALGSTGYTLADDVAMDLITASGGQGLPAGARAAALYGWLEWMSTGAFLLAATLVVEGPEALKRVWASQRGVALGVGAATYAAYVLVLWAYALSDNVAYVAGMRQLSIVFGVGLGVFWLGERASALRLAGVAVILFGLLLISVAA